MKSPFSSFAGNAQRRSAPSMPAVPQRQEGIPMQQLQNLYRSVFSSANPMEAMQKMMASNPKFAQIQNLFRQGQTPEGVFRQMAAQRGINPDEFIRQLQGNNGR